MAKIKTYEKNVVGRDYSYLRNPSKSTHDIQFEESENFVEKAMVNYVYKYRPLFSDEKHIKVDMASYFYHMLYNLNTNQISTVHFIIQKFLDGIQNQEPRILKWLNDTKLIINKYNATPDEEIEKKFLKANVNFINITQSLTNELYLETNLFNLVLIKIYDLFNTIFHHNEYINSRIFEMHKLANAFKQEIRDNNQIKKEISACQKINKSENTYQDIFNINKLHIDRTKIKENINTTL